MRFLDLFAGIGGFHQAMKNVNSDSVCVGSVEFNSYAASVYEKTYGIKPFGDIKDPEVIKNINERINSYNGIDILFAGFPCQTFSKAGLQKGFEDETRGTLFFSIKELLREHRPKFFVLENVRNLLSHKSNDKKSFDIIMESLRELGYVISHNVLSPHKLNNPIPQMRDRVFIYGILNGTEERLKEINNNISNSFQGRLTLENTNLKEYISNNINNEYKIEDSKKNILNAWEQFVRYFKELENKSGGTRILTSPIWTDVFYKEEEKISDLSWKQKIIDRNLDFYNEHKQFIDKWYIDNGIDLYNASNRKFEWNANSAINSLYEGIIQFRPSGIRVKKPDVLPTFVAINHKPIIGWKERYLTPNEISHLYGFEDILFSDNESETYKQLGNTVSVDVAKIVIEKLTEDN